MVKTQTRRGIVIYRLDSSKPVRFAAKELSRYLGLMTGVAPKISAASEYDPGKPGIWLGLADSFGKAIPPKFRDSKDLFDDGVFVRSKSGHVVVSGVNERSVVFAAYRFLEELGCRWFRPGPMGESVPQVKAPLRKLFQIAERPSARHRCICIEGSCSFAHVRDMIDYAAKRGFNAYYFQFLDSFPFFNIWHSEERPRKGAGPFTHDDAMALCDRAKREVSRRGMAIHSVGHGWTTQPFGIDAYGWGPDKKLPPGARKLFAKIDGKRGMFAKTPNAHMQPLITNLCYSNPRARAKMVKGVAEYAAAHPKEEVIHVWLADGSNNNCECSECKKARPSDFYVQLLNELDAALAEKELATRIVFLAYVDLLWAPQKRRIANPDRFVLMFAPITRTYTAAFLDKSEAKPSKIAPYRRNKLVFPNSPQANLKLLDGWRKKFKGECVDFDYHLWGKSHEEPTLMRVGRVLFEDIRDLPKLGMDGFISCQYQRIAFPTGLPMHIMGMTLWNRNVSYNRMVDAYFADLLGLKGKEARKYLEKLSALFDPPYVPWRPTGKEDFAASKRKWAKVAGVVKDFRPTIQRGKRIKIEYRQTAWNILEDHACYALAVAEFFTAIVDKNFEEADCVNARMEKELNRQRKRLAPVVDIHAALRYMQRQISARKEQG